MKIGGGFLWWYGGENLKLILSLHLFFQLQWICSCIKIMKFSSFSSVLSFHYVSTQMVLRANNDPSCTKHIHDRIISLRGEVWAHKTSLTLPLLFNWNACTKPGECTCVLGISSQPVFMIFLWDFGTVLTMWFFFFILLAAIFINKCLCHCFYVVEITSDRILSNNSYTITQEFWQDRTTVIKCIHTTLPYSSVLHRSIG